MSGVAGKVVAITGASSGIGEATALLLAEQGAKVVLGARGSERLEKLATRITEAGGEAVFVPTDVRRQEEVARLVEFARTQYGRLDVLISNAGVMPISPLDELRVEDWEAMIDVNLKGVLYGVAAALPVFREQEAGHFVHTASTAGLVVKPEMAVYAGTKYAVRAVSEGLRQEAGADLRVTVISPGVTRTNFADSMTNSDVATRFAGLHDIAMPADAVARAIAYAISQPTDIDVSEIVIRPTAQA